MPKEDYNNYDKDKLAKTKDSEGQTALAKFPLLSQVSLCSWTQGYHYILKQA